MLHPDEPYDGHAGTDAGFRYRMIYVEPARLQEALFQLAQAMRAIGGASASRVRGDIRAARVARAVIHDRLDRTVTLDDLASAAGRDRRALARDFGTFVGTRQSRYLVLQRLERARREMMPADAAALARVAIRAT